MNFDNSVTRRLIRRKTFYFLLDTLDSIIIEMIAFLLVLCASIISIWLVWVLPPNLTSRCEASLPTIDLERHGEPKRYLVHEVMRRRDLTYPLWGFVSMGIIFAFVPIAAHLGSWGEVKGPFVIEMTVFGLIFALITPLIASLSANSAMSRVLVVIDGGFEVWRRKKDRVRMVRKVRWSDIHKFMIYWTNSRTVLAAYLYTEEGRIIVKVDGINAPLLLHDLQRYIPDVISRSDEGSQVQLNRIMRDLSQSSGRS